MVTERQRAANRANAKRSTGPRTAAGKAAASRNARRHGLAARRDPDAERAARIERLAREFAGAEASPTRLFYARIAAEATLELADIRSLRVRLIEAAPHSGMPSAEESQLLSALPGPIGADPTASAWAFAKAMPSLARFERYERRAWSRRKTALRRMDKAD